MRRPMIRLFTTVSLLLATLVWADPPAPQCDCGQPTAECQKTACACGPVKDGGQCPLHAGRGPRGPSVPKDAPPPAKPAPAK